jgi:hypothetical protein
MNHSIATADRMTHLKIVVVALIAGTLVAGIGVASRVGDTNTGMSARIDGPVIKAGKPTVLTTSNDSVVR